ncbi:related to helix-loop-helix protein [Fusarium oxysporum]|uniref:Related to helix-loop-helix protein n=1 Tax=Fusarium oxysporum TaxID=5507 RepID=A0A2H3TV52_FUSOX|nr:related to helix-loop-helix protein [Fusarium oxysporum]
MPPAPSGHSHHQQPISSPNRTSRNTPPPPDPADMETHQQAHHPAPVRPMSIAWGLSGVGHQNPQLNSTLFNFIVPGTVIPAPDGTSGHHSYPLHALIDAGFAYGSELVSPSGIQPCRHYDSGFPGHRDGTLSHGACTPKVLMPTRHVTNSPWVELDEAPQDNNPASASQPRRTPRTRRKKKEAHNATEASQGGSSGAAAGAGTLSLSDVASPSSTSRNSRTSINSKSTSMASTASSTWGRQRKLRSASRTSKNNRDKPNDAPEERRARASHNRIEKHYRNRLNAQFESLLNALPAKDRHNGNGNGDDIESDGTNNPDRRVSKGEVLEMARKRIQALERESNELQRENLELQGSLRRLNGSASDGTVSSPGGETPFNFNQCVQ